LVGEPAVAAVEEGHAITFELKAPNDVRVRVVDDGGKIVRRLACGVVGRRRAATPLKSGSLKQRIVWDGRDDAGKPVDASKCEVVIDVGMTAAFDKFLLYTPDAYDKHRNHLITPTGKGEYLVVQGSGVHLDTLRAFDAKGKFVRQVWPFSLDKPVATISSHLTSPPWGAADWDGDRVPFCVNHNARYAFGVRSLSMTVTSDGYVIGSYAGVGTPALIVLDPNGLPHARAWRKTGWYTRKQGYKTRWMLAAGREGDFFVADDFHHVVGRFRAKDMTPVKSFAAGGQARHWLGELGKPGEGDGQFNKPDAVAIDTDGHIHVRDAGGVKVFDATGKLLRKGERKDFPKSPPVPKPVLAVMNKPKAIAFPHFLTVDSTGRLYVQTKMRGTPAIVTDADGKSFRKWSPPWGYAVSQGYAGIDADDNRLVGIVRRNKPTQVWKYSPKGERLKFGEADAITVEAGAGTEIKGVAAGPGGDVYVVVATSKWRMPDSVRKSFGNMKVEGAKYYQTRVDVFGPDGKLKTKGLIRSLGLNDVGLDRAGNVYAIEATMWHGAQMSGSAQGRRVGRTTWWPMPFLSADQKKLDPKTESNKIFSLMGRLLKFSPTGGALDGKDGAPQLWAHAGVSGMSPWNCGAECPAGQLALDDDGRIWTPDTFMYCVSAVDAAGNLIARVGKYGNEDAKGGGGNRKLPGTSIVVDPEIPLARPSGLAVHGDWLFISDMFTHRIVRCKLGYAHTTRCKLAG